MPRQEGVQEPGKPGGHERLCGAAALRCAKNLSGALGVRLAAGHWPALTEHNTWGSRLQRLTLPVE